MSDIIKESIDYCIESGIKLNRGPAMVVAGGEVRQVDWCGAVMHRHGIKFVDGWLKQLVYILGRDTYWFWRFNYGFSQCRVMQVYIEDLVTKKRKYINDEASKSGMVLARGYGL